MLHEDCVKKQTFTMNAFGKSVPPDVSVKKSQHEEPRWRLEQGGSGGATLGVYEAGTTTDWSDIGAGWELSRSVFAGARVGYDVAVQRFAQPDGDGCVPSERLDAQAAPAKTAEDQAQRLSRADSRDLPSHTAVDRGVGQAAQSIPIHQQQAHLSGVIYVQSARLKPSLHLGEFGIELVDILLNLTPAASAVLITRPIVLHTQFPAVECIRRLGDCCQWSGKGDHAGNG